MITNVDAINNHTGNNSATTFDFDFLVRNSDELVVIRTDSDSSQVTLVLDTDYSINELENENGSYITFPLITSSYDKLQADETLSIYLDLDFEQQSEFGNSSSLNLQEVENSFDYVTRLCQILKRENDRAIKSPIGTTIEPDALIETLTTASAEAEASALAAAASAAAAALFDPANYIKKDGSTAFTGDVDLNTHSLLKIVDAKFTDANSKITRTGNILQVSSDKPVDTCNNCYYDGSNWQRIDTGAVAYRVSLSSNGFKIYQASAGANPISSWDILNGADIYHSGNLPQKLIPDTSYGTIANNTNYAVANNGLLFYTAGGTVSAGGYPYSTKLYIDNTATPTTQVQSQLDCYNAATGGSSTYRSMLIWPVNVGQYFRISETYLFTGATVMKWSA